MNRTEKASLVGAFGGKVGETPFVVVTEFRGTKVSEINGLRRDLEKNGMSYRVIKNTLARRAFSSVGYNGLDGHLKGMTGVVLSGTDGIASAKLLREALKTYPSVQVRAGWFEGGVIAGDAVKIVSELPGREELLGRLLATIIEGPRQLVTVLSAPGRELVTVLKNYEIKLSESESEAAPA